MVFGWYCDASQPDSHAHNLCLTKQHASDHALALQGCRTFENGLSYLIVRTWLEHDENSIDGPGGSIMGEIKYLPFSECESVPLCPRYPALAKG